RASSGSSATRGAPGSRAIRAPTRARSAGYGTPSRSDQKANTAPAKSSPRTSSKRPMSACLVPHPTSGNLSSPPGACAAALRPHLPGEVTPNDSPPVLGEVPAVLEEEESADRKAEEPRDVPDPRRRGEARAGRRVLQAPLSRRAAGRSHARTAAIARADVTL